MGFTLSHQTSSHYVIQNGLRMGWLPDNFEQVQISGRPSLFTMFVANPESLYYVQEVRTQFEPVQTNILRTSLVWRVYIHPSGVCDLLWFYVLATSNWPNGIGCGIQISWVRTSMELYTEIYMEVSMELYMGLSIGPSKELSSEFYVGLPIGLPIRLCCKGFDPPIWQIDPAWRMHL